MAKRTKAERDKLIHVLYAETNSMSNVAKRLSISKSTVHKVLNCERSANENEQLVKSVKEEQEKSNQRIVEIIQGQDTANIVKLAIGKLTSENMDADIQKSGIGNMYRLIGMFTDKVLAIKEKDIRLKELDIKQSMYELKKEELELRKTNPEAFQDIKIINDAPRYEDDEYTSPN